MTTCFAFEPAGNHIYPDHPESPDRLNELRSRMGSVAAEHVTSRAATRAEVALVHTESFIDSLEQACSQGDSIIDFAPTYVTGTSFTDALLAAGATIECTRRVLHGYADNAFAIVRPPGHHAEPDRAMGFCLMNNVAIAAAWALIDGLDRVAIVDFDAHHGNGTQAAFLNEARVAYLSMHQWGIYPGTGWYEEAPRARGRIVNVPLPALSGDKTYARIADEIVLPFLRRFRPSLLLLSAGFDGYWNDPLTSLGLSTAGFQHLSNRFVAFANELCAGRIVVVLEGGYDPHNVANGSMAVFSSLTGTLPADAGDAFPNREPDVDGRLAAIRTLHGY